MTRTAFFSLTNPIKARIVNTELGFHPVSYFIVRGRPLELLFNQSILQQEGNRTVTSLCEVSPPKTDVVLDEVEVCDFYYSTENLISLLHGSAPHVESNYNYLHRQQPLEAVAVGPT